VAKAKYVTILLIPEGTEARTGWRVRSWVLRGAVIAFAVLLAGIVVFFAAYGKILSRAAVTDRVIQENSDLKRYYYKVQLLEQNLRQARDIVTRMTKLAGVDFEFPELPGDSAIFAAINGDEPVVITRPSAADWSIPVGLPIQGFVTQEFNVSDSDHFHPGVDIACAVGTPVLATGSGVVETVAVDSVYGLMIIVRHNDSTTTVYGHNDRVLANQGDPVLVGSRIALSGSSGRSTAPHLHYELRIHGKPINPMDNPYDQEVRF